MSLDANRLAKLAESYIDHLLLLLKADNGGANLRDFLDPWWSLSRGARFVKRTRKGYYSQHTLNNPCPREHGERLLALDWVSAEADAAVKLGVRKKARSKDDIDNALIVDHAVPLAVIHRELFSARDEWDQATLTKFLHHHYRRGLLTKRQDASLNANENGGSLKSAMPAHWQRWDDPFARYHARSIVRATESVK